MNAEGFYVKRVQGAKNWSNIFWALFLFFGSLAFLYTGVMSYIGKDIAFGYLQSSILTFIPQGLVMCFYGIAGLFVGSYLGWAILFNVGAGYNEVDCKEGILILFRWGFPGRNRKIRVRCLIRDIERIIIYSQNRFGARATITLELQNGLQIPFYSNIESWTVKKIEEEAAQLAQWLQVPLDPEE